MAKPADRFMLWVDAVGGYWVCLADELIVGQPGPTGGADIPILADISARHAGIRRGRFGQDGDVRPARSGPAGRRSVRRPGKPSTRPRHPPKA